MQSDAILSLLADLYMQVTASQNRVQELEAELAEARAAATGANGGPADAVRPAHADDPAVS